MATRAAKAPARKPATKAPKNTDKLAGRPSKYRPEFAEQARKLCELGATDADLADFFKVAVSTVALWKVVHEAFSDALKASKSRADDAVERSLFQRAIGYEHDEVDIRVVGGEVVQTAIRKRYPPDPVSMIFWLKNRRPDAWRAAPEPNDEGSPTPVKVEVTVKDARLRPDDAVAKPTAG